jgi:hypothetical protein
MLLVLASISTNISIKLMKGKASKIGRENATLAKGKTLRGGICS